MKLLVIDTDGLGLSIVWRAVLAGHDVKWFIEPKPGNNRQDGNGFKGIKKVSNWVSEVKWADLIISTSNDKYVERLAHFKKLGFPVFGPSPESAKLEISRQFGMEMMKKCGIDIAPYEIFKNMDQAKKHVEKTQERYVFKTLGDNENKALTYCSKNAADLVAWMERIIARGDQPKGDVMLQTFIKGIEMGVSRFMGKKGFVGQWNESFEHKKLMPGNHGCNTGEMGCYDEQTEVLTSDGWKFWRDVTIEDSLATLNDNQLSFETPSAVVCYDVDGDMYQWKNQAIDILVTPNHNMYVQSQHNARNLLDDYDFVRADECTQAQYSIKRTAGWVGSSPEFFIISGNSWNTGRDGSINRNTEDIKIPFSQWCKFLGIFIAEGSTGGANGYKTSVSIAQSHPEKSRKVKSLLQSTVLWEFAKEKDHGFVLYCAQLARVCASFGRSYEKRVPDYIKNATPEDIQLFLDAFLLGDGNIQKNGSQVLYTSNRLLADDLQELLLKVGKVGIIKQREAKTKLGQINGRTIFQRRPAYEIYIRSQKIRSWLDLRDRKIVQYKGKVYCATVSSHVLFVRRNGKPIWCGNTVAYFTPESKLGTETLAKCEEMLVKMGHTGDVAIGFMIDDSGKPWPTEWTCYDAQTEVLTVSGWRLIKDCSVGDVVATLDPKTNLLEYRPVEGIISKKFDGELLHFRGDRSSVDLMVTPDHSMWCMDGNHEGSWQFRTAGRISESGNWKIKRSANWIGEEVRIFTIPAYTESHKLNWPSKPLHEMKIEHPAIEMPMDEWLKFLGLYISEGSMGGKRCADGIPYVVNIAQKGHRKPAVRDVLAKLPFKFTESKNGFQISCRQLCLYMHDLGLGHSFQKFIPREFMNMSARQLDILLEHLIMGDGSIHKKNGQRSYSTTSPRLADEVQELILKTGGLGRIICTKTKGTQMSVGEGKVYTRNHNQYSVSERKKLVDGWVDKRMVKRVPYIGEVYCLNVPPHHLLYVRRNGNPAWCGNCRFGWPIANMMLGATQGDPVTWMKDALEGKDTTTFKDEIGCCIVLAHGDFPHGNKTKREVSNVPLYGITKGNKKHIHPVAIKIDELPDMDGDNLVRRPVWNTTGDYVAVVTGFGKDVKQACSRAYKTVEQLHVSDMMIRDDVGEGLEKQLPELHRLGYATHCEYEK